MKTIKIFVASSEELKEERKLMASLANDLSTKLEKIGIQVIAVEWENLDASMGEPHKQEEYNEKLRECEMCMVLYWTKFGIYTKKELDTAYKEKIAGKNPQKLWVYFKEEDNPDTQPSEELKEFRDSFPTKYGHFYTPFANFDTLKAHFLLQFMEYQSQELQNKSIVEVKNGKVTIDGKVYVDLQNVPFAGNYKDYKDKLSQLKTVKKILTITDEDDPDYKDYQEQLKTLHKEIKEMEEGLWDTALMITRLSNTRCSERLKRAADLFEKGDNNGARAVLNEEEIEHDIEHNLNLIKLGEEGKEGLKTIIEELNLKLKLLRAAEFKFKDEKYGQIENVFRKILECTIVLYGKESKETCDWLMRSAFHMSDQPKRYIPFLEEALLIFKKITDPTDFFSNRTVFYYKRLIRANKKQGYKDRVIELYNEIIPIILENCGENSEDYFVWLSDFGNYYARENYFSEAEQIFKHCIDLCHKFNGFDISRSYYNLADLYIRNHDIQRAQDIYDKIIDDNLGGDIHNRKEFLLYSYLGIADHLVHMNRLAETYYIKAIDLALELKDEFCLTSIYKGLADVYFHLKDIPSEISYLQKIIEIRPDEFDILIRLADRYATLGDYKNALRCGEEAIKYAQDNSERRLYSPLLKCYRSLTRTSRLLNDLEKSEFYGKLGLEYAFERHWSSDINYFYQALAIISCRTGNYNQALSYYNEASQYARRTESLTRIGWVYYAMGDYEKAEKTYLEAIDICEEERNHLEWATPFEKEKNQREFARIYTAICGFYIWTNNFDKAQEALSKSYASSNSKWIRLMDLDLLQARIYLGKGMFEEAIKQLESNKPSEQLKYQWQQIMAETYIKWGKNPEALEWIDKLLQEYADDPYVHEIAGDYYVKFGDKKKAIEHYEFGLKLLVKNRFSLLATNKLVSKIEQIKKRA